MSTTLGILLVLGSNAIVDNVPAAHAQNQGYQVKSLSQVLTPWEYVNYIAYGNFPPRVGYSGNNHKYVVKNQNGFFKNDLKKQRQKQKQKYKVMPRWEYMLRKFLPTVPYANPIDILTNLLGVDKDDLGDDGDEVDDGDYGAPDIDNPGNGGDDNNKPNDEPAGEKKDNPKDNNGKNPYSFPSFPTSMPSFPTSMPSFPTTMPSLPTSMSSLPNSLSSYWNKGKTGNGDKTDGPDYKQAMKDVLTSDVTKEIAKAGVGMLPAGPAILAAAEIGSKVAEDMNKGKDTDDTVKDVLATDAGKTALKAGLHYLPGGDAIVAAMDAGSKVEGATKVAKKIPGL